MNILIEKKEFSYAVYIAARFAERKSTSLAALTTILFIANDEGIKMRATNLETAIDLKLKGKVVANGVVAIPAATLQQIAGSFSQDGTVTLEQSGDIVLITTETGKSTIKTIPYDDFPTIPLPEITKNTISINGIVLKNLFSSLASCASPSTIRPELASIYLSIEGGILTAVATDSFRLAEKKVPLSNKGGQGKLLIPAKNAVELAQALSDDEAQLSFDEHQCVLTQQMTTLASRLTNATYPDYHQIIPKDTTAEATVLRKDLESALKRTTVFSDAFQKVKISFDQKKKALTFYSKNIDIGESNEKIPATLTGTPIELSFNHRYLSAVFSLTNAESLKLSAAGIGRPLIVRGVGDNSLLYLVSPMNQ